MKYQATFTNGVTVKRTSDNVYVFAWAVFEGGDKLVRYGFSARYDLALKAAKKELWPTDPLYSYRTTGQRNAARSYWPKLAADKGMTVSEWLADYRAQAEARNAHLTIDVVAAKLI